MIFKNKQTLIHCRRSSQTWKWTVFRSNWDTLQTPRLPLCQIFKLCLVSANPNSLATNVRPISCASVGSGTSRVRGTSWLLLFPLFLFVLRTMSWHNGHRVWQPLTYFAESGKYSPQMWQVLPLVSVAHSVVTLTRRGVKINGQCCNYAAFSFSHPLHNSDLSNIRM